MVDRDKKGRFSKGNKLAKGGVPKNKIYDEFTDKKMSRSLKHYHRMRARELEIAAHPESYADLKASVEEDRIIQGG